jgi:hypothetical protein
VRGSSIAKEAEADEVDEADETDETDEVDAGEEPKMNVLPSSNNGSGSVQLSGWERE